MEIDLTGSYPIVLNGEETGTLSVTRDGLYWVFDAKCAPRAELVRLTVFGGDGEGYLGVMEPCGDALVLTKRLSRAALAGFPSAVTHAGNRGEAADATVQSPPSAEAEAPGEDTDPQNEDKPPSGGASLHRLYAGFPVRVPARCFPGLLKKVRWARSGARASRSGTAGRCSPCPCRQPPRCPTVLCRFYIKQKFPERPSSSVLLKTEKQFGALHSAELRILFVFLSILIAYRNAVRAAGLFSVREFFINRRHRYGKSDIEGAFRS